MISPRTIVKIGEFKQDDAGNIYFDREKGRLNEAHALLAFSDKIFADVKDKKVRVTISIEEIN